MTEQEYMTARVDDQIKWYSQKSSWNQKRYHWLKAISLIGTISLPFLISYTDQDFRIKVIAGLVGVAVAIIEGVQGVYKFHENWLSYRKTEQSLQREKLLYATQSGIYKDNNGFTSFVDRIESIMAQENQEWIQYLKTEEKKQVVANNE
jgi:hypothetical protein